MRNVRRSGSLTSVQFVRPVSLSLPAARNSRKALSRAKRLRVSPTRKFSRTRTPCAMKSVFSLSVNSVGSRPFHETRKHFLQQAAARAQLFVETVLDETGDGIVKTVRQGEWCSALAACVCNYQSRTDFEKFVGRLRGRRFCEGRARRNCPP